MLQLLLVTYVGHCLYAAGKAAFGDPGEFRRWAERWRNLSR